MRRAGRTVPIWKTLLLRLIALAQRYPGTIAVFGFISGIVSFVTVDRHGNTSAGSVPLALDEAVRSGRVQRGQLLLLEAFGGGFTWGSALLRY